MKEERLRDMLRRFREGVLSEDDALEALRLLPFQDIDVAKVDHHRALRCGFPEVILCEGKTCEEVVRIVESMVEAGSNVLATRAQVAVQKELKTRYPEAECHGRARTVTLVQEPPTPLDGKVAVVCAGTSDIPVAEEARVTAEMMGATVETFHDVGVAGLHRLLRHHRALLDATAIVVVAGMEGALASVVGGLVSAPVVAVPTSVGYGASFGGLAPLLTMLNSCAAGVSVVNIDNGFGAGYVAALICRTASKDNADE